MTAFQTPAGPGPEEIRSGLPSWSDGPALRSLVDFLFEVTRGPTPVPLERRIATFDNDGTLACEKPETSFAAFLRDRSSLPPLVAHENDMLTEVVVNDDYHLPKLVNRVRAIPGVARTESFLCLKLVKQTYNWGTR